MSRPTTIPTWATSAETVAETADSPPSAAKRAAGWEYQEVPPHQYHNWLFYWTGQWLAFLDPALFYEAGAGGQHLEDGNHWEMVAKAASGNTPLTVNGDNATSSSVKLVDYQKNGASIASVNHGGEASFSKLTRTSTDLLYKVIPALAMKEQSSGTVNREQAYVQYTDSDATSREFWVDLAAYLPANANINTIDIIAQMPGADNTLDMELFYQDSDENTSQTSNGAMTQLVYNGTTLRTGTLTPTASLGVGENGLLLVIAMVNGVSAGDIRLYKLVVAYTVGELG